MPNLNAIIKILGQISQKYSLEQDIFQNLLHLLYHFSISIHPNVIANAKTQVPDLNAIIKIPMSQEVPKPGTRTRVNVNVPLISKSALQVLFMITGSNAGNFPSYEQSAYEM